MVGKLITPGERLKYYRLKLGLKREEFASRVGIGYLRLTNVENGKAKMYVDDLKAVYLMYPDILRWILHGDYRSLEPVLDGNEEID